MHAPIAALGSFIFGPSVGSFEEMERRWSAPRASLPVIGGRNQKHWMGPTDGEVTITGSVWPEIQLPGLWKIDAIGALAGTGRTVGLLEMTGRFHGLWGICEVNKGTGLIQRRGFPGEITFSIVLESL